VRVALGWAKMAVVAAQNPRETMDRELQVLAKSVHVDALAKAERALCVDLAATLLFSAIDLAATLLFSAMQAERALSDAGIQLLNVSDYAQTRGSLLGGEEERSSQVDVQL